VDDLTSFRVIGFNPLAFGFVTAMTSQPQVFPHRSTAEGFWHDRFYFQREAGLFFRTQAITATLACIRSDLTA